MPASLVISVFLLLQQPYYDFSRSGAGFYGAGREDPDPADLKSVAIGVLGPEKDPAGLQLRTAVEIAVEEANQAGGYRRRIPYQVVFKADDGPWGMVGNRVVELAYEDKVWTIIGGLDGQRTHIAELISAKAWIPVVSPSATDTSVDYANVPWVFRVAPADSRQAEALVTLAERCRFRSIVAITQADREAYTGYKRLQERLRRARLPLAGHLQYTALDFAAIVPRLKALKPDAIILWGTAASAKPLIESIRAAGIKVPVLGPSILAMPQLASGSAALGDLIVAAPFDSSRGSADAKAFDARFRRKARSEPSWQARYAYDSARLVMAAIEKAGLNRARIRDELVRSSFDGIAGKIEFDSLRGNTAVPVLMKLRNHRWVTIGSECGR